MREWVRSHLQGSAGLVHSTSSFFRKLSFLFSRWFSYLLMAGALGAGFTTYLFLTRTGFSTSSPRLILILINVDLVFLLLLAVVVCRKIIELWIARRQGLAGSQLHVRLVVLFSLLAITPAIVVATFSVLFFNFGLRAWFSERVESSLNNSLAVAEAYLNEHRKLIQSDALSIGREFANDFHILIFREAMASEKLNFLTHLRSVPEAIIFDANHQILARSNLTFTLEFEMIPQWAVDKARNGDVVVLTNELGDRVRALMVLDMDHQIFLYIGRFVDPMVLNYRKQTVAAVSEYHSLKGKHSQIEIRFALVFLVIALLLLFVAIWIGLTFANQLSRPIRRLVMASEKIRKGDLSVRVEEEHGEGELMSLSRAFNRMASQLEQQRSELVQANQQLDQRRQFTESVLGGVSAGVIGLDVEGRIHLPNQSASRLLGVDLQAYLGQSLNAVSPEMGAWFQHVHSSQEEPQEGQITINRDGVKILFVRLVVEKDAEQLGAPLRGFVITFDDMTALLSAQRKAAWSDVARRIAHEIKNPLTPIQLSAERLQRKYLKEIQTDPETFKLCTDTIIRQVEDIGRMVDEFSAFARMPVPLMSRANVTELCEQALFLQRSANPSIDIQMEGPDENIWITCDRRLIMQALTNLLQNALDSVYSELAASNKKEGRIKILLFQGLSHGENSVTIVVEDNGKGLPEGLADRLTDPYVTTKVKGTGLGLAIVKKIMEDHNGYMRFFEQPEGGVRVELTFTGE